MILPQADPLHGEKLERLQHFVGSTPLFALSNIFSKPGVEIYAKLEWQQLGGSVKARPAFNIIKEAILMGDLAGDRRLLDASSGNTAIAYATIGANLGISVSICLPENASEERKDALRALGAEIILTSKFGTTDEAQDTAKQLAKEQPERYFYADQYGNENNWKAHYYGTGNEVFEGTNGRITHFVAGLGTTGTFTGTGRKLKHLKSSIELVSLQPDSALHGLEGWKHMETAKVPRIYDPELADRNLEIDTYESLEYIKKAAQVEGLFLSPSSAANLLGAIKVAQEIEEGVIVTVFPDNAEKYGEIIGSLF
jgi:cysteine synthase B